MGKKRKQIFTRPLFDEWLLFATGAPHKQAEFRLIADLIYKADMAAVEANPTTTKRPLKLGISILDELASYHSAVEDGVTGTDNVRQKAFEAAEDFDHLREGHSLHNRLLAKLSREHPIAHDQDNIKSALRHIRLFTEDFTASLPLDIWRLVAPVLSRLPEEGGGNVNPKLLYLADGTTLKGPIITRNGKEFITIVDIGPIVKTCGPHRLFETIREAAAQLREEENPGIPRYEEIPYIVHCDCAIARLSDAKEDSLVEFKSELEMRVFLPDGISTPIKKSPNILATSDDYLALTGRQDHALTEDLGGYIANHSPRRMVFDQLMAHLRDVRLREQDLDENLVYMHLHSGDEIQQARKTKLKIARPTALPRWNLTRINGSPVMNFAPTPGEFAEHLSGEFRFKGNRPRHPDVVILPPFDPKNPVARIHAMQALMDITTAKQIDQRFYPVQIIVQNLNRCYDDLMRLHKGFMSMGYCGDYERHPFYDGSSGARSILTDTVGYKATGMVHEISGSRMDDLDRATSQLVEWHGRNYVRNHEKPRDDGELRGSPFDDIFGVGYFSSATCQRRLSLETAGQFGSFVGKKGYALITGGGDQYLMNAPIDPYIRNGGKHLGLFSTFGLVAKETAFGRLRPAQLSQVTRVIGTRIVKNLLKWPDQITSWDGGRGTGQEECGFLSARYRGRTDLVRGKYLVGFDPYHNDPGNSIQRLQIIAMFGPDAPINLAKDHDAYAESHGFRYATDLPEIERITLENAGFCMKRMGNTVPSPV